jgi:hypothetical protein
MNGDTSPVINEFQGSMMCVNGGYLNLGEIDFGGNQFYVRLQFRLLNTLMTGGTLFRSTNRLTQPLDDFIIQIGFVNAYTADLVIKVEQNGYVCTNSTTCSLSIPGSLHLNRDIDIIIGFNQGTMYFCCFVCVCVL